MAFSKVPSTWFGAGYDLTSSVIGLETASLTSGRVDIDTVTSVFATGVLTVGSSHGLTIGKVVQFTTTGTLPAGLSLLTDYYVLTVPAVATMTVSATLGGTVVTLTDNGTGTHTINRPVALTELTDTEANATTGDVRKIVFAIMEKLYDMWRKTAAADRPTKMRINKSESTDVETGITTKSYSVVIYTEVTTQEVQNE